MEEQETPTTDYIKGFNEGYVMSKHLPGLAASITSSLGQSVRSKGFKDGYAEAIAEQSKGYYPAWLKGDRLSSLDKDEDKQQDRDIDDRGR